MGGNHMEQPTAAEQTSAPKQSNENLILFIRAARPDWSQAEIDNAVERLARVKVDNVLMLLTALRGKGLWKAGLNSKLESVGEKAFTDLTIQALKTQADVLKSLDKTGQSVPKAEPTLVATNVNLAEGAIRDVSVQNGHSGTGTSGAKSASTVAFQTESQRRAASLRLSGSQRFRVVQNEVSVHALPRAQSKVLGRKYKNDVIIAFEETFDRWAHLEEETGWVFRGVDGDVLTPEGDVPLLAAAEVSALPGPMKFEVVFAPHVPRCSARTRDTEATMGLKNFGDVFFAEAQSYDGWVRLIEGGWVPSCDPDHGQMLSCTGLEEEKQWKAKVLEATKTIDEVKSMLYGNDMDHARSYARYQGWTVHLADLQRERKLLLDLRQSILKEIGKKRALSACAAEARRLGHPDEAALAHALMAKTADETVETSDDHNRLLQAITDAAAAGDMLTSALARDAAIEAGIPKKEISRAFAIGNSK